MGSLVRSPEVHVGSAEWGLTWAHVIFWGPVFVQMITSCHLLQDSSESDLGKQFTEALKTEVLTAPKGHDS